MIESEGVTNLKKFEVKLIVKGFYSQYLKRNTRETPNKVKDTDKETEMKIERDVGRGRRRERERDKYKKRRDVE